MKTVQAKAAVETISREEQERFTSILSFWHKIEFFIPFDLEQRIAETDECKISRLYRKDLDGRSSALWQPLLKDDEEVKFFNLYLGVFDKSEITKVCDRVLRSTQNVSDEEFERTDLEGRTCFAQLTIDPAGQLVLQSKARSSAVSYVSTLPWALGQFEKTGLSSLTSDRFEQAKEHLGDLLLDFKAAQPCSSDSTSGERSMPLTHASILQLHEILERWAGFSTPDTNLIGMIETVTAKKKTRVAAETAEGPEQMDEAKEAVEPEIAILNSFFIQDIEMAINSIRSGQVSAALKKFLSPLPLAERLNLESVEGIRTIWALSHPKGLHGGRWLSDPDRSMTLMQQFAINSILQIPADTPFLFSVNGPPGTGKTTLLRDIFADLIVRRARALAQLRKPSDAFLPEKKRVTFASGQNWKISPLRPEITGFEMVVASSNNAAVENISGDLPKAGSLGARWQASEYLKSVAYKVAAQRNDGSFKPLADDDQPWGLISCALGNSANRTHFKERLFYMDVSNARKPSWQTPDRPQTLLEWIDNYSGPDFATAKRRFEQANAEVEKQCTRLEAVADILNERFRSADEQNISLICKTIEDCRSGMSNVDRERAELMALIRDLQSSLGDLQEQERLLNRTRPGWWARLRRIAAAKRHKISVHENASAQLQIHTKLTELRERHDGQLRSTLAALSAKLDRFESELKAAVEKKRTADQLLQAAQSGLAPMALPARLDDLRADDFQKSGLWHLDTLAQQRSELFAAALSLHEAWLASVGKPKAGFRPNIFAIKDVLSGRRLDDKSNALSIWQSLFLIVPVVSTTFASFHNQFGDLAPGALGWLFIDEAGQAVPQAAVGALSRAKHAVAIGDPLQIEPVFTLPGYFISAVAELSRHTRDGTYSPNQVSVQGLADQANQHGVVVENKSTKAVWVGSPLRVHRRCLDPMFSWSNEIAYGGKMIFGLPRRSEPDGPPIACESSWIDVRGETRKRQEVPRQTQFVFDMLQALYERDRQLPGIYLISPFKAIKTELINRILSLDWLKDQRQIEEFNKDALRKWCKERIGTVHTFQGKEEDTVMMILGADPNHTGSADWACATPNILNVALTRARRRFYVVGDRELWSARGPFGWSTDQLPAVSAERFLTVVRDGVARSSQARA